MKEGVWEMLARMPARQESTTKGTKRWEQPVPQEPGLAAPAAPTQLQPV